MNSQPQVANNFSIKTDTFEGPFGALLAMIEKKKLHISEVSLSEIADDYIAYVRAHEFVLKDAAMFIWTAATLMLIKSRHLLPQLQLNDEETEDTSGLERRVKIYAVFKKQIEKIEGIFGKTQIYSRLHKKKMQVSFRPDSAISLEQMRGSIEEVFTTVEPEIFKPVKQVAKEKSLREVIDDISMKVRRYIQVNFHELVLHANKKETAVSFLAILELFKQGQIDLEQDKAFETIAVSDKQNKTHST